MENIIFDKQKYLYLKSDYETARINGHENFIFDGHELYIEYAKYLIEYLQSKFEES
jgi:hypothetical protein